MYKGALYVGNKIYCFYKGRQKLKENLYAIEVDKEELTLSKHPVLIITGSITSNTEFIFDVSLDKRKFSIITSEQTNLEGERLSFVYSFDADLNLLFAADPKKNLLKNEIKIKDYKIDNQGRVDLLIKYTKPTIPKTFEYYLISYEKNENDFLIWDVGDSINDMQIELDTAGKIFITGFYGWKRMALTDEYGFRGIISEIIDPYRNEISQNRSQELPSELLKQLDKDVLKEYLFHYHFIEFHIAENGYKILVFEKILDDILIIGLNPDGEINWFKIISRKQVFSPEPAPYKFISLKSYILNDDINLLYNSNNVLSGREQLNLLSINILNGSSMEFLLFDSEITKTRFVVKKSKLFNEKNIFLYGDKQMPLTRKSRIAIIKF